MPFSAPAASWLRYRQNREDAFNLEAEAVEAAITPASKALLIVTPSNPTAGIVTEERARAIADVAIRHNLIVIVDEIYGKIVYEPWRHFSIGSLPGMAERAITLDAFSKAYAMTGWRCGYVAAPANVIDAMARVKQVTTGPVATVSQWAGLAAITGPQDCVIEYLNIYTERRAVLLDGLDRMGFAYGEPRGGLFVWADSSSTGIHAAELSYLLLKEGRVLDLPGYGFRRPVARLCAHYHAGAYRHVETSGGSHDASSGALPPVKRSGAWRGWRARQGARRQRPSLASTVFDNDGYMRYIHGNRRLCQKGARIRVLASFVNF